jgi:hypothetical protein
MKTNWRDFGIGMASGIALCFVLYFGWGLIRPHRPDTANVAATSNAVGMDENALIAANAERQNSNALNPPPQLRPEPQRNAVEEPRVLLEPEPRPEPPATRPRPRPDPDDEPPPEDLGADDDPSGKPDN